MVSFALLWFSELRFVTRSLGAANEEITTVFANMEFIKK